MSTDTRTKLRRAQHRLDVRSGPRRALLDEYQELLLRWWRERAVERGLPVALGLAPARHQEPLERYRTVARRMGGSFRVVLVVADDRPVAGILALIAGRHAHYWRAINDGDARPNLHASSLLISELAREAAAHGCLDLDLSESGACPRSCTSGRLSATGDGPATRFLQPRAVTSTDQVAHRWIAAQAERAALAGARRLRR